MRQSMYANMVIPAGAQFSATGDCCGGTGGGAVGALAPQENRFAQVGGASSVLQDGAAPAPPSLRQARGRGGCRCWWVALGAIVVIALVAAK